MSNATNDPTGGSGRVLAVGALTEMPQPAERRLSALFGERYLTDDISRRERSSDWWPISKVWAAGGETGAMPAAVVRPNNSDEVAEALQACAESGVPVTVVGGRSAVCGQAVPALGGLVMEMTAMDQVIDIDDTGLMATVEPGILGDRLEDELNSRGLTLGHFPQSIAISTVGGWIACRSAGQYSTRYGKIENMLLGADIALARPEADGNVISLAPVPASAAGPDLKSLVLGSEGTLGVLTRATLALWPLPQEELRRAYAFSSFEDGLDAIRMVMRAGARPACMRLYDIPETARHFSAADTAGMIVICHGDSAEIEWTDSVVRLACAGAADGGEDWPEHWLETRNDVSALDVAIDAGLVVDTFEVAAPWADLPVVYQNVRDAVGSVEGTLLVSAHCSHAYPTGACLYFTFAGSPVLADNPLDSKDAYYAESWDAALDAAMTAGATVSHHHGIGLVRMDALAREIGTAGLSVLRALKRELDPAGILNPAKLVTTDTAYAGVVPWPPGRTH